MHFASFDKKQLQIVNVLSKFQKYITFIFAKKKKVQLLSLLSFVFAPGPSEEVHTRGTLFM